jgi:hypothetical protein
MMLRQHRCTIYVVVEVLELISPGIVGMHLVNFSKQQPSPRLLLSTDAAH